MEMQECNVVVMILFAMEVMVKEERWRMVSRDQGSVPSRT